MKNSTRYILLLTSLLLIYTPRAAAQPGKLRIATSQFPVSADIDSNGYWIKKHMTEAKQQDAQLIHFPECALSGYAGVDFKSLGELDWQKLRQETKSIMNLADELDLWVLLGSTHQLENPYNPHNSLYVIDPQGQLIDRYDKRFCTNGDLEYYSPGDHFVTFQINEVKCALLICYDVRFPELYRRYRTKDVHIIFQSFYNARQKPGGIHPKIMPVTAQARAATNSFFMSLSNSSATHSWPCHFITPDGLIAQKLETNAEGILISDVDINKKYYDASKPFRLDAIDGKLNSGKTVQTDKSKNRTDL